MPELLLFVVPFAFALGFMPGWFAQVVVNWWSARHYDAQQTEE